MQRLSGGIDAMQDHPGPMVSIHCDTTRRPALERAVREGGGGVASSAADADAVVWTYWSDPDGLRSLLADRPRVRWVQLATAGVDAMASVIAADREWTCAKGCFSSPIAEHALTLALTGMRQVHAYARASAYGSPSGRNLLGARVVIVGGGGIAGALVGLLQPFGAAVTVVRRHPVPMPGVDAVVGPDELDAVITRADVVVLALALTDETRHVIGSDQLAVMRPGSWLVNVSRGAHVDTNALVDALAAGAIGGAALDVTDPEPLPEQHPLWSEPRCIITPHTACTPEMGDARFATRVRDNVARRRRGEPLLGRIDPELGY